LVCPQAGAALLAYENRPRVEVRVHPYFSDDQLWEYLASLSVSVLPYRFGTHSGWLEACHDLGTAIIAPDCGFYHQQRPAEVFRFDEDAFDADSLRAAVHRTHDRWQSGVAAPRPTWEQRRSERHDLASAHARLYREALI
jgi:hypothetical protein